MSERSSARWAIGAWLFLAGGALALALAAGLPSGPRLAAVSVLVVAAITAILIGAARHLDPPARRPWWLVAAAFALFRVAGLTRLAVPRLEDWPPPVAVFIPKFVALPGYLLLAWVLMIILRRRRATQDDLTRIDALLVGLGLALIVWAFVTAPAIEQAGISALVATFAGLFPAADVFIMVLLAYLFLSSSVHSPAMWLFTASIVAFLITDLAYLAIALRPDVSLSTIARFDVLVFTGYIMAGAAALHPSMRTLAEPQDVVARSFALVQSMVLAVAIAAPAALAFITARGAGWNRLVRVVLTGAFAIAIVWRIGQATARWRAAESAELWRATHDELTGLANAELLTSTLTGWGQRSEIDQGSVDLLFIDIDRFRIVNGTWGRGVGDELLGAVAERLSGLAADHFVCRFGMDKFVIAVAPGAAPGASVDLAQRLVDAFPDPYVLSVGAVSVTASIGVSTTRDTPGDPQSLIHAADTAMYEVKDAGRNGWRRYDPAIDASVRRRATLERALRGALDRGELSVHYQPIIDLGTGDLTGFEALMRWTSPEFGPVSPGEFIPIAEYTGTIVASGGWLLERAAEQILAWNAERRPGARRLHVSANLSVRQLADPGLVDLVNTTLSRLGLPASALWLEITESRAMENPSVSLVVLRALVDLGVTVGVDDFGTGYSSLSYLTSLPARIIKIDRSLIAEVGTGGDTEAVVQSVISMAKILGRMVVAEGVETAVQHHWLRSHGCDFGQGYLYGAPREASIQTSRIRTAQPWVPEAS